jgi:hypothetical protein
MSKFSNEYINSQLRELSLLDGFTFDQLKRAYDFFMIRDAERFPYEEAQKSCLDRVEDCVKLVVEGKNEIEN